MAKAKQLEAKLGPGHPTFVKTMTQYSTYKLEVFAEAGRDGLSTLDEQDKLFEVKYQAVKHPHFTRWSGFFTYHKLGDGDCLLFQLIQPTVFKVYIIRASSGSSNI